MITAKPVDDSLDYIIWLEDPRFPMFPKNNSGYTFIGRNQQTRELDELFGLYSGLKDGFIDNRRPAPEHSKKLIDSAIRNIIASNETEKLVRYMAEFAKTTGFFPALSAEEICRASGSLGIAKTTISSAIKEDYAGLYIGPKFPKETICLTSRFATIECLMGSRYAAIA